MPTLIIKTNAELAPVDRGSLIKDASAMLADMLGKPERYVMVLLEPTPEMCLGGEMAPLAYLELKSLGLPEQRTPDFSNILCRFIETRLKVPSARIYIEFAAPERHMFGFDGGTF